MPVGPPSCKSGSGCCSKHTSVKNYCECVRYENGKIRNCETIDVCKCGCIGKCIVNRLPEIKQNIPQWVNTIRPLTTPVDSRQNSECMYHLKNIAPLIVIYLGLFASFNINYN